MKKGITKIGLQNTKKQPFASSVFVKQSETKMYREVTEFFATLIINFYRVRSDNGIRGNCRVFETTKEMFI